MADVKLGNTVYSGVETVKLNTTDGGTAVFAFTAPLPFILSPGSPVILEVEE